MPIFLNGLLLGLSLIMALGPQNAFLIRQGAMRQHAALSALVCFFCDLILITGSVIGLQDLLAANPPLRIWMTWFGAAFLMYYGLSALRRAFRQQPEGTVLEQSYRSRWQIVMLALGFSLLNPHAIVDSLVLIGGGCVQFPGQEHVFLLGVLSSSLLWFSALTFLAYYFSTILARDKVWRRVELGSGLLMLYLSLKLALSQL